MSEAWLRDWHDRYAGSWQKNIGRGRPSPYDVMADFVREGDDVLDVACGDGALMALARARGARSVAGIDVSEGELTLARQRLGAGVPCLQGRAQALPFPDAAFDLVTCQLALMLMSPVEPVISEMGRVLRTDGRVALLLPGSLPPGQAWECLITRLVALPKTSANELVLGDPRTDSVEGLKELFAAFTDVSVQQLSVVLDGSPRELWALFRGTYDADLLDQGEQTTLERQVLEDWSILRQIDGTIGCTFGFQTLLAQK